MSDTPADAPAVRKMSSGSLGNPSRSGPGAVGQLEAHRNAGYVGLRTFDELRDALANERHAFTVSVRAYGPDVFLQLLRPVQYVLRPLVLHDVRQGRILHECRDLRGASSVSILPTR